jgi:hypothetical protein
MPTDQPRTSSWIIKGLVVLVGIVLMLVAVGVLQVNPGQIRASRPVLFATGLVITMVGLLAFLRGHLAEGSRGFRIGVGVTVAAAAALVVLVTINSHDEALAIGPFVFRGPAVDTFGKVFLGFDSLLLAAGAVWLLAGAAGRRGGVDFRRAGRREDA